MLNILGASQPVERRDSLGSQSDSLELRVYQVFYNIRYGWAGLLILLLAISYVGIYVQESRYDIMTAWVPLALLMVAGHAGIVHTFLRKYRIRHIASYAIWGYSIAGYSLLVGVLISIGVCFVFENVATGWDYFLIALIIMPGFGSAVTSTSFLIVHTAWVLGTNVPLGIFLLMQNQDSLIAIGMLVLFAAVPTMLLIGAVYERMYRSNIVLKMENIELIHDLKVKADIATQSNQDKSRFLAAASHDLRQPHQALGLFLESLDYLEDDKSKKGVIGKAKQAFQSMSSLLDQLLDISKLDSGVLRPAMQALILQPFLQQIIMEYMGLAEKKGLELRLRPTEAVVYADPLMLRRILSNLLSNAIRNTKHGGVLVAVRRIDKKWKLMVYDTGIGIPASKYHMIFQEFTQLENPRRDRERGLGLGLAIVRRLAQIMELEVAVQSVYGRGTCFSIVLDSREHSDLMHDVMKRDIKPEYIQRIRVVVVDDDSEACDGLVTLLRIWGIEVRAYTCSIACVQELEESLWAPDAIIVDYRLREGYTGIDAIHDIFQACQNEIPALIISGDTDPARIRDMEKAGFPLLHKPIRPQSLKQFLLHVKVLPTKTTA